MEENCVDEENEGLFVSETDTAIREVAMVVKLEHTLVAMLTVGSQCRPS